MGAVYLADDRWLERKVAVKLLRSSHSALDAAIAAVVLSGSQRAQLLREAHAVATTVLFTVPSDCGSFSHVIRCGRAGPVASSFARSERGRAASLASAVSARR
jgi:hypothetical protein